MLIAFYEIDENSEFVRAVEVRPSGDRSKYDRGHPHDDFGMLPENEFDADAAAEWGELSSITETEFENEWTKDD